MGNSVKVKIISEFDSWGTVKAGAEMEALSQKSRQVKAGLAAAGSGSSGFEGTAATARKGAAAVAQLSAAMGEGRGGLAVSARVAGAALSGFALGGWVGMIVQGAVLAISWFSRMRREASEAAKTMGDAFRAGLAGAKENRIAALVKEFDSINVALDLAQRRMEKLAAANGRLNRSGNAADAAGAANTAKNIEAGYQTRMASANTPEERALLAAQKNIDLVRAANEERVRAAQADVALAERAQAVESDRRSMARERLAAAREQLDLAKAEASGIPAGSGYSKAREAAAKAVESARNEILKASADVEAGAVEARAAELDLAAASSELATARTDSAMRENEVLAAQDEIYAALKKRVAVLDRLAVQEGRLENAVAAAAKWQGIGERRESFRDRSVASGAAGFREERASRRAAAKEREDGNAAEMKWLEKKERQIKNGTKLTGAALQRFNDARDFRQLRQRGGEKAFDIAASEKEKIKTLQENLAELRKLNGNLEKSLAVN